MRGREGWGCTSWGILGEELCLLDVLRRRMEYPELKRAVRDQYALYRPSVVLIEGKASGTQLIQELVADALHEQPVMLGARPSSTAFKNGDCRHQPPQVAPDLNLRFHLISR
jgi:phage terminase large subunit-like protein